MAMGLAKPGRGDRPPLATVLLPLLPPSDRTAVLRPSSRGCNAVFDPEHRELVSVGFRGVPDRAAAPGHLCRVPPRQTSVLVRGRVLEHDPGAAGADHPRP